MAMILAFFVFAGNEIGPHSARSAPPIESKAWPAIARPDAPGTPGDSPGTWFEEDRDRPESEAEEDDPESSEVGPVPATAACLCWSDMAEGARIDAHPPAWPGVFSSPSAILRC